MSLAGSAIAVRANPAPPLLPIRNVEPVEVPFAESSTVTVATPTVVMSAVVMAACNCDAEINVVVRAPPLNCTTDEGVKFVPWTVKLKPVPPAIAEPGFRNEIAGACGLGFGAGVGVGIGTGTPGGEVIGSRKLPATSTIWPPSVLNARPFWPQRIMRRGVPVTPVSGSDRFKVNRERSKASIAKGPKKFWGKTKAAFKSGSIAAAPPTFKLAVVTPPVENTSPASP